MEKSVVRFISLVMICLLACTSCATHKVKGKSPFVSISSMAVNGDALSARFDIRNINDVDMVIDSAEITIRVREAELTRYNDAFKMTIGPNTTEELRVDRMPDDFSRQLLDSLESGEAKSLPFFLEGRVHTRDDGFMSFRHEGHLYPVPGRPGQFRSASTSSRQDR